MVEDKGTSTPEQQKEPTRGIHIPRVVEAVLLASLIASSIVAFFFAVDAAVFLARGDIDKTPILWGIRAVVGLVAIGATLRLIRMGYDYQWTGWGEAELPKQEGVEVRPRKTLWDWLDLLLVPLILGIVAAGLTAWFNVQQDVRQNHIENQRAEAERKLAEQRAQDEALQSYLDQMGTLMLNKNLLEADLGDPVFTLAQARTSTVMTRVDGQHNRTVTRFLTDAYLSQTDLNIVPPRPKVGLLRYINLDGADVSNAELVEADLTYASLSDTDLSGAGLVIADLSNADVDNANLRGANLIRADLTGADLTDADLTGADLYGCQVSQEQLEQAESLKGATMPNGQKYEDWLKSKGRTEEG